jgi:predicted ATP-grasp superfamily ATP-dependent carboligase
MIHVIFPNNGNYISGMLLVKELRDRGLSVTSGYTSNPEALNINFSSRIVPLGDILNVPESVELAANKRRCRQLMRVNGIGPKIYIPGKTFCKFPMVLRPDHHHQGKKFAVVKSYEEMFRLVRNHGYTHGIEIIYPNREFRVIVGKKFNNEIVSLKMVEKIITYEEDTENWLNNIKPKNHSQGNSIFNFVKNFKYKNQVREAAKKAFFLSGLDFGAVDILFDQTRNIPYVLEINTRFAMSADTTLERFTDHIINYHNEWINWKTS